MHTAALRFHVLVRTKTLSSYAFPQTPLWKSGPCGAVPPRQGVATGQCCLGSRYARLRWISVFDATPGKRVMSDGLSELYQELLSGSYDCVDRIVLNAYFGMGIARAVSACGGERSPDRTTRWTMPI